MFFVLSEAKSMTKSAVSSLGLAMLLTLAPSGTTQQNPAIVAEEEGVRRQEQTILLRRTLLDASEDRRKGDLGSAAKGYEEAWGLAQKIGATGIDSERKETVDGLSETYLQLAEKSYRRAQYQEAKNQVARVLRVDPKNNAAQEQMARVEKMLQELDGRVPSKEVLAQLPEVVKEKIDAGTLVQDGRLLYEMGKLDEAEVKLRQAAKIDPSNAGAFYYLKLIDEARYSRSARKRELMAKEKMLEVENAWNPPVKWGGVTNSSNPFARTNTVHTGAGRRAIFDKLGKIQIDKLEFPLGVPLSEVIKYLDEETMARDPERQGLNFIIAPYVDLQTQQPAAFQQIDPTTGQPIQSTPQQEQFDLHDVKIRIEPALRNVRLLDALDAIVKVAEKQIKYSVDDYAVMFTRKIPEQDQLFTRTFKVNPNTFVQGLEGVQALDALGGNTGGDTGGGGGLGGGGGGFGGGGGGGGGFGGGGGGVSGGGGGGGTLIPRVFVAGGGRRIWGGRRRHWRWWRRLWWRRWWHWRRWWKLWRRWWRH